MDKNKKLSNSMLPLANMKILMNITNRLLKERIKDEKKRKEIQGRIFNTLDDVHGYWEEVLKQELEQSPQDQFLKDLYKAYKRKQLLENMLAPQKVQKIINNYANNVPVENYPLEKDVFLNIKMASKVFQKTKDVIEKTIKEATTFNPDEIEKEFKDNLKQTIMYVPDEIKKDKVLRPEDLKNVYGQSIDIESWKEIPIEIVPNKINDIQRTAEYPPKTPFKGTEWMDNAVVNYDNSNVTEENTNSEQSYRNTDFLTDATILDTGSPATADNRLAGMLGIVGQGGEAKAYLSDYKELAEALSNINVAIKNLAEIYGTIDPNFKKIYEGIPTAQKPQVEPFDYSQLQTIEQPQVEVPDLETAALHTAFLNTVATIFESIGLSGNLPVGGGAATATAEFSDFAVKELQQNEQLRATVAMKWMDEVQKNNNNILRAWETFIKTKSEIDRAYLNYLGTKAKVATSIYEQQMKQKIEVMKQYTGMVAEKGKVAGKIADIKSENAQRLTDVSIVNAKLKQEKVKLALSQMQIQAMYDATTLSLAKDLMAPFTNPKYSAQLAEKGYDVGLVANNMKNVINYAQAMRDPNMRPYLDIATTYANSLWKLIEANSDQGIFDFVRPDKNVVFNNVLLLLNMGLLPNNAAIRAIGEVDSEQFANIVYSGNYGKLITNKEFGKFLKAVTQYSGIQLTKENEKALQELVKQSYTSPQARALVNYIITTGGTAPEYLKMIRDKGVAFTYQYLIKSVPQFNKVVQQTNDAVLKLTSGALTNYLRNELKD